MFSLTVFAVILALSVGLLVKLALGKFEWKNSWGNRCSISLLELAVVGLALSFVIAPVVSAIGATLSVSEQLRFEQFVNGVEDKAIDDVTECKKGHASSSSGSTGKSNCANSYVSGHYYWEWTETVQTCTSDSDGNQSCTSHLVTHTERAAIYTPYATREHTYTIHSSMGGAGDLKYTFPTSYLDKDPQRYSGSNQDIPGNLPKGPPKDWAEAKARLDADDPRSATKLVAYENPILASQDDVLMTYGPRLDEYKAANLLPEHTANINSNPITGPSKSQADKVSFVNVEVADKAAWQQSVMRFNAALGMDLQGDLHVVLVDAATVPSNDAVPYTQSLKAYWQSDAFGRRAIAKNGIILVLGVDKTANKISWADASTGMPFGNEGMTQFLRDNLVDKALEPDLLFGRPRTVIDGDEVTVTHAKPEGIVENIVFEQATFKRFSMSCDNEDCIGYKDLASQIEPTTGAKVSIVLGTFFISLVLWLFVAKTDFIDSLGGSAKKHVLPRRKSQ